MVDLIEKFLRTFARRGRSIILAYDHGIEHTALPTSWTTLTLPIQGTYLN